MTAVGVQGHYDTPDSLAELNASLLISSVELNDRSLKRRMTGQGTVLHFKNDRSLAGEFLEQLHDVQISELKLNS
jgi:hypothetical protein